MEGGEQPVVSRPSDSHVQVQREERSRGSGSRDAERANRSGKRENRERLKTLIYSVSGIPISRALILTCTPVTLPEISWRIFSSSLV